MKEIFWQKLDNDLEKLGIEVEQYPSDEALWVVHDGINNSSGNLCLHLLGNLNHYIGAKLGKTGYVRDRPAEFSTNGIKRAELAEKIEKTSDTVRDTLLSLPSNAFTEIYPDDENGPSRTVAEELIRIIAHFSYHLGQINYHRRLTDGSQK